MLSRLPHIRSHSVRRLPIHRSFRWNSPAPSTPRRGFHLGNAFVSGAIAGVVGGSLLLGAGYAWYRTTGLKKVLDTVRPALMLLGETRSEIGHKHPIQALSYLRQAAKSYVAYLPGAGILVDKAFDAVDDVVDLHRPEANGIVQRAYQGILEVIQRDGNEHKTSSALEIIAIARGMLNEMKDLGIKAGAPLASQLELEKRIAELGASTAIFYEKVKSSAPGVSADIAQKVKDFTGSTTVSIYENAKSRGPEVAESLGDMAKKAKDFTGSTAASVLENAKSKGPEVVQSWGDVAEKTKNHFFPPKSDK